jgi:hypothetical protein
MSSRFDELAKALARGLSRREALRLLGGTLMAAVLAPLGAKQAWGDVPGNGKSCGETCGDAGVPQGTPAFSDCVHKCGQCQANALQACVSFVGASLSVTCCGPTGTCGSGTLAGVCVCPGGSVTCSSPASTLTGPPTTSCCTGVQACNQAAGVCIG